MLKRHHTRFKGFMCLLFCIFVVQACANNELSLESSASLEETLFMEETFGETQSGASVYNKSVGSRIVSGFDEKTNQTIIFHGIEFSFPAYFDVCHEDSTEDVMIYYPEEKSYYARLQFNAIENTEWTPETFEDGKMSVASEAVGHVMVETFGEGSTLTKSEAITIAGLSGWTVSCVAADGEDPSALSYSFVYVPEAHKMITVFGGYDNNDESDYDYLGDYEKIIESATLVEVQETAVSGEQGQKSTKSSEKIDPGFKAMMDGYEEFFNSYAEFMKKYSESGNSTEMLMEYLDFMEKYTETMKKLEEINIEELSAEEYKYYMDVHSRITKKLLEVYEP